MKAVGGTMMLGRSIFMPTLHSHIPVRFFRTTLPLTGFGGAHLPIERCVVRWAATKSGGEDKKSPARLAEVQRLVNEAEERYKAAGGGAEPIPKITLDHVTISYARSGGPGGQNVNKVNTKVDMRFNVKNAHWLSERVRERIMQMEKNRINKDGEIVISSTKTRTQKGNIEDALGKLQGIIDAASYVPPPPSEETVKRIAKLSAIAEQKRLDKKKVQSQKKALRRSRDGWD
ncbi:peptidyl-tRNA hydrolase ICT1, mitochondrial-like isoform X2 [Sesamum indicum]|nr:peptidyl-tRNA hydrolase ICT1, mitochondrial-like isoform X2 [Sesamum indicum]XP_020548685.1 peptidyl-tRNA hydrolase ICT1, mitochondrial-like isoform X2 [Sesamum indicum]